MALAFPLSLFGGGLVALLGAVELTHVLRDRDQPSDLAKSLRKFAERGVLTRVEMVEGQWYGYRNPDQLKAVYTRQIKFAWIFICSALLILATAHLVQRYLGVPRNWKPWEYAATVGIFTALAALMTAYLLWFAAKAHHRFQVKDGVLHVDTGKAILVFPALPSKACNQISGRSMWLSAYDVYGHWPRSYALDPRYLEPQST